VVYQFKVKRIKFKGFGRWLGLLDFFEPHCCPRITLGGESECLQRLNGMKPKGAELHETFAMKRELGCLLRLMGVILLD
jgi:hypothetical protein